MTPRVLTALALLAVCGCSTAAAPRPAVAPTAQVIPRWGAFRHAKRPLDLAGARRDGAIVLAAAGRLWLLAPASRALVPFAPAYRSPGGEEPYIALAGAGRRGCSFGRDTVYAIRLHGDPGVTAITAQGRVRRFVALSAPGLINGIAFDETGRFGYRLLVTINSGATTTVDAVDCHGTVTAITRGAPRVEGGIAVAPAAFGAFAGDLIAPDEKSGMLYAITPSGQTRLVANSGLSYGPDTGVESEAFVPAGGGETALLADRLTPGNRHPGDDLVLALGPSALARAGVRPGDLLVAGEGGAQTDAVGCSRAGCRVRHVADGPAIAHGEGHIAFTRR